MLTTTFSAKRRRMVDAIKLEAGCTDCGYNAHPAALQFDHRDATTKSFSISSSITRAWPTVLAEIAKCDVVCANCHAIRTAKWCAENITGQPYAARNPRR